ASEARVRLFAGPAGAVAEVHSAAAEVGQGVHTILTQIVRTELGVEHVMAHPSDTQVGSAGSSSASRQTMMSGGAAQLAAQAVREVLFDRVRRRAGVTGQELRGELTLQGGVVLAGAAAVGAIEEFLGEPIEETRTYHHRRTRAIDASGQGDPHVAFAFAAQRAVVDVDTDLGLARVVHIATAQDVGRAINPQSVSGQIEGGTAQGLGLALMEEIQLKDGLIRNASFTDYLIPTILDMPPVASVLVEEPEPGVPYGAKGVGEPSTVVSTAAIAAALRNATGRELNSVPVHPDDLAGLAPPVTSPGPPPSPDVPGPRPVPYYFGLASGQAELISPD
ncbi:MAG: xanthine dehydrogenase family protein molybdopterin-binding subunit, partial [Candidatus Methylomirabilaceae bacterium]